MHIKYQYIKSTKKLIMQHLLGYSTEQKNITDGGGK